MTAQSKKILADALWANEVEDRIDAYERGEMSSLSAQEVFDRIDRQQDK